MDRKVIDFAFELDQAHENALNALARYKFAMFGYWAAIWVHLNRISGLKRPNPFKNIVQSARKQIEEETL